jgi:hypothetical protein
MRLSLALLMVLVVGASQARADNPCASQRVIWVDPGFTTGAQLNNLDDADLAFYAAGFADGWLSGMLIGASEQCHDKVTSCLAGRKAPQLGAMLRKHLRDNPAEWHKAGGVLVYQAIFMACLNK